MQIDLFGGEVAKPTVRKKSGEREPMAAKKIAFDRKALWSRSGYLPGSREIDEEESALAGSTSDTRSDNATIERLEAALGLKPVVRNGQWVCNELEYQYRRSEEHTSELQSRENLVCRLLLEKKKGKVVVF